MTVQTRALADLSSHGEFEIVLENVLCPENHLKVCDFFFFFVLLMYR